MYRFSAQLSAKARARAYYTAGDQSYTSAIVRRMPPTIYLAAPLHMHVRIYLSHCVLYMYMMYIHVYALVCVYNMMHRTPRAESAKFRVVVIAAYMPK